MPEFYSPNEGWPRHQEGYWRDALEEARRGHWTLKYLGAAHTYGWVSCPSGEHQKKIGQTARNNETKAKELIKAVGTCERRGCGVDPADALAQRARIEQLLQTARHLVLRAETGLDVLQERRAAEDELQRLEGLRLQLMTAAANLEAVLTEADIADLEEQALEAAVAAEGPGADELRADLDSAAGQAREAASEAGLVRPPDDARAFRDRADALGIRIQAAITRLDGLQERSGSSDG